MSNLGENNNETANGNQEEYEYDPDFIEETENLDPDLVLEAQDSFDQESGRYPAYLYEQDQRSADEYEEDVPYQQYADSRTQFDEQAEAVAAMSSLSLQCLSSPSKRDSLDEGYDPDETLKIIVSNDGKKVDILRDSDEDEYFPEELADVGHDDDEDVILQEQRPSEFDRWDFMKDPAVLAKDTAQIHARIALGENPLSYSPEPKEVRFLDMDTRDAATRDRAAAGKDMASLQPEHDDGQQFPDSLEPMEEHIEHVQPEKERRRSSQISGGNGKQSRRRQSIINPVPAEELTRQVDKRGSTSFDSDQAVYDEIVRRIQSQSSTESKEDLRRKIEKLASSSLDSDQAVYLELMKKLQSQSDSEMDSDTMVYKEIMEGMIGPDRSTDNTDKSEDMLPEQKKTSRARHQSMKQPSTSLQRMGNVAGSSVESNGYYRETGHSVAGGEEEDALEPKYYRHGDQT